jgi:hypothetical protein
MLLTSMPVHIAAISLFRLHSLLNLTGSRRDVSDLALHWLLMGFKPSKFEQCSQFDGLWIALPQALSSNRQLAGTFRSLMTF